MGTHTGTPYASIQAGALPPATPKLHPQTLYPTLLVEKEEELRKERERRKGDSISEHDFSNKLLMLCFLSPLKVTGWETSKTNHLI